MQYNYEKVKCAVCKNDNTFPLSNKGQFDLPVNVVLCKDCGLGYLNPRWDNQSYMNFYATDYDKYYRVPVKNDNPENYAKNPIIRRLDKQKLIDSNVKNILDIGSGEGENLRDLGRYFKGSKLYAIEPSPTAQDCLRKLNINILGSDINEQWEKNGIQKFDLIIMRHVLEHFLDPVAVLNKVNEVLSPNGIVYIAVPNSLNPNFNLESHWFRVVHTYYYNKYSLINLTSLANLKIINLLEGDDINSGEVFLMAKKSESKIPLNISNKHYQIQKKIFDVQLKKERTLLYKSIKLSKKLKNKFVTIVKS